MLGFSFGFERPRSRSKPLECLTLFCSQCTVRDLFYRNGFAWRRLRDRVGRIGSESICVISVIIAVYHFPPSSVLLPNGMSTASGLKDDRTTYGDTLEGVLDSTPAAFESVPGLTRQMGQPRQSRFFSRHIVYKPWSPPHAPPM
jgi:hypothetical protein